jgi:hypothetical protein
MEAEGKWKDVTELRQTREKEIALERASMELESTQRVLLERNMELWVFREQIGVAGMFTPSPPLSAQLIATIGIYRLWQVFHLSSDNGSNRPS